MSIRMKYCCGRDRTPVLDRWFRKKTVPLTGAPPVRRLKTYSALSGYVYQYFYAGQRPYDEGTEFVFEASADRTECTQVSVLVPVAAVSAWEAAHGRVVIANERYAIAKMALFVAFDERESPRVGFAPVTVTAEDVERILETLQLD